LSDAVNTMPQSQYFSRSFENNPYYPMNIVVTSLDLEDIKPVQGDEIAVYDGELCVGVGIVSNDLSKPISIVVSMDDPLSQKIDGFVEGNKLVFKYMSLNQKLPLELNMEKISGTELFVPLETLVCRLVSSPNGVSNLNSYSTTYKISIYPNPTQDFVSIDFNNYVEGDVIIELMNLHGNSLSTVYNQNMDKGLYHIKVSASEFSAGVYYFRVMHKTDTDVLVEYYKLVVTK